MSDACPPEIHEAIDNVRGWLEELVTRTETAAPARPFGVAVIAALVAGIHRLLDEIITQYYC